ncbi:MAG TPA: AmmeMemoRadiSam system radical SAM enzyme [bacterium]|nr:AmmeMemoRadiSam system radical SAM enzyme [bacterium]HPN31811.1 AmmeMemoRadiSam system radical SAM enzyme [bacterium]
MNKTKYFRTLSSGDVQCLLCPVRCVIKPNAAGFCGARKNISGTLESLIYGKISAASFDPIEKKPMYHFFPGKEILSIGSAGCNLKCLFCQNSDISQSLDFSLLNDITGVRLLDIATSNKNNIGIAFTYNEPIINFEFVSDVAGLFKKNGLRNVLVSNGMINPEPLSELVSKIDGANIDLKGADDEFYKKNCKAGNVKTVLNTIETLHKNGVVVEATNLIITDLNDSMEKIKNLVDELASISNEIPLHFSRYFPRYKCSNPPTPEKILREAFEYGKTKLKYVYTGNANMENSSNTYCPECGKTLIERRGYSVKKYFDSEKCPHCGEKILIQN